MTDFVDSRRLTGPSRYFTACGAVLSSIGPLSREHIESWRQHLGRARSWLGWPAGAEVVLPHQGGVILAFEAPLDQLYTASEANEWAFQSAQGCSLLFAPGHPLASDADRAKQTLQHAAAAEHEPRLLAVVDAAGAAGAPVLLDDEFISIGYGCHSRTWPRSAPPDPATLPFDTLRPIPLALVSGSNGKTTSVRLLSSMLAAAGFVAGHSCTDGLFVGGELAQGGDYSGPAGARQILRDARVEAAVLETARGGLMRRGLAVSAADVALLTNISEDHFGEYGIDDVADLADAKLTLARGLHVGGALVCNADDAVLAERAERLDRPILWFSAKGSGARIDRARAEGGDSAWREGGRLVLQRHGVRHDLGAVDALPLSLNGAAAYNIANLLGAALAASCLPIPVDAIRSVLCRFGASRGDNPGRLQHFQWRGVDILLDYAHNPDGLAQLIALARQRFPNRRLGLLLGQAGNRGDRDIDALADAAVAGQPSYVVLKDIDGMLRGRAPLAVPRRLHARFIERGFSAQQLAIHHREFDAVRAACSLSRSGDVLVLPVHASRVRDLAIAWLMAQGAV